MLPLQDWRGLKKTSILPVNNFLQSFQSFMWVLVKGKELPAKADVHEKVGYILFQGKQRLPPES